MNNDIEINLEWRRIKYKWLLVYPTRVVRRWEKKLGAESPASLTPPSLIAAYVGENVYFVYLKQWHATKVKKKCSHFKIFRFVLFFTSQASFIQFHYIWFDQLWAIKKIAKELTESIQQQQWFSINNIFPTFH